MSWVMGQYVGLIQKSVSFDNLAKLGYSTMVSLMFNVEKLIFYHWLGAGLE